MPYKIIQFKFSGNIYSKNKWKEDEKRWMNGLRANAPMSCLNKNEQNKRLAPLVVRFQSSLLFQLVCLFRCCSGFNPFTKHRLHAHFYSIYNRRLLTFYTIIFCIVWFSYNIQLGETDGMDSIEIVSTLCNGPI